MIGQTKTNVNNMTIAAQVQFKESIPHFNVDIYSLVILNFETFHMPVLSICLSAWQKLLLGFGLYENTSRLFNTNVPKGSGHLNCLDGIRFLSMSWVVMGHVWSSSIGFLFPGLNSFPYMMKVPFYLWFWYDNISFSNLYCCRWLIPLPSKLSRTLYPVWIHFSWLVDV